MCVSYDSYWAKTCEDLTWHPLWAHSLDVAACGQALLKGDPKLLQSISHALRMKEEDCLFDIIPT